MVSGDREFMRSWIQWGYSIDGEENWAVQGEWGGDRIPRNYEHDIPEITGINSHTENGSNIWSVLSSAFFHEEEPRTVQVIWRNRVTYVDKGETQVAKEASLGPAGPPRPFERPAYPEVILKGHTPDVIKKEYPSHTLRANTDSFVNLQGLMSDPESGASSYGGPFLLAPGDKEKRDD